MNQLEMVSLDELVSRTHMYRRFIKLWDFKGVEAILSTVKSLNPHEGYGLNRLFRCLLLQFMEDLSDRELEKFLQENISGRWFCGFMLNEDTPDHTVFTRARSKIGTDLLADSFSGIKRSAEETGVYE
jgi:transposase, IS5 family